MKNNTVSTHWLKENMTQDNLIILDSSPVSTIKGKTSLYPNLCLPTSRIFDIKRDFVDKKSKFPNTIPSPLQFEKAAQSLGIHSNSEIVVYDNLGIYTSARVWWLFKIMGHQNVKVLDGGLVEWIRQGYEIIDKADVQSNFNIGNFKSVFQAPFLIRYEDIIENMESKKFLLVDARSKGRFDGTAPEPRKHLKSGSVPDSVNIPYSTLLKDGKFKSEDELYQIFSSKITNPQQLVFSCGSGMTACIVMLASHIAFKQSNYLYDGSWTEYAEIMFG